MKWSTSHLKICFFDITIILRQCSSRARASWNIAIRTVRCYGPFHAYPQKLVAHKVLGGEVQK